MTTDFATKTGDLSDRIYNGLWKCHTRPLTLRRFQGSQSLSPACHSTGVTLWFDLSHTLRARLRPPTIVQNKCHTNSLTRGGRHD
jgi:hypothetical protein